jgi:hypothetical protein
MRITVTPFLILSIATASLLFEAFPRAGSGTQASSPERRAAIRRSIAALEQECATLGGGDWSKWYDRLAPVRAELQARVQAGSKGWGSPDYLIELPGTPVLFERSDEIGHLAEAGELDSWIARRPVMPTVVKVKQWLEKQGIDLIFVPVPRAADIYPDRIAKSTPPDKIVAPQVKKLQLDLLKSDVEVLDLLPEFLVARTQSPESLSLPDDPHWGPAGQEIAARLIAERLSRYAFVQSAIAKPPLFHEKEVSRPLTGGWRKLLTPEQVRRLEDSTQVIGTQIFDAQNREFQPIDSSPIVLMGDSLCTSMNYLLAPGSALDAQISKRINLPITVWMVAGNTVGLIKDTLRNPEMLKGRRVIIWLVQEPSVCSPTAWTLPPLPEPGPRK